MPSQRAVPARAWGNGCGVVRISPLVVRRGVEVKRHAADRPIAGDPRVGVLLMDGDLRSTELAEVRVSPDRDAPDAPL
jgi:hypothetical protein